MQSSRSRPSLYFHSIYGKEREDQLVRNVKDVIEKPTNLARTILISWARFRQCTEFIPAAQCQPQHLPLNETNGIVEVVDSKYVEEAVSDLIDNFGLPLTFPSGLRISEYKISTFIELIDILSIANPFWLLEISGRGFEREIKEDYEVSDNDLKYIRSWLVSEFSLPTSPTLIKSQSY